jgi:hypothetical protein
MKKIGILVIACVMSMSTMVSLASAEIKVSGDVYAGMASKYVFRGLDLSQNKWVAQFGADLAYKGLTLSYWSNLLTKTDSHAQDINSGEISETDITLNYTYSPIELLTFNVGNTFYSLADFEDTNELYLKATVNTLLSPTLAIYWDWDQAQKAGLFYSLSVGHSFELIKKLNLNLGALVSYNQQNYSVSENFSNWNNYELSTGLDYAVTDNFKLSASYTFSNAISGDARDIGMKNKSIFAFKGAFNF